MEKALGGRSLDRSQMWNAECGMQNKNSEIRNPCLRQAGEFRIGKKGDFNANRSDQFASRENSREEGGTN